MSKKPERVRIEHLEDARELLERGATLWNAVYEDAQSVRMVGDEYEWVGMHGLGRGLLGARSFARMPWFLDAGMIASPPPRHT